MLSSKKKKPFLADPKFLQYKGFSVCDEAALLGMRTLAMPREGDPSVVSGESGAGPLGAVQMILEEPKLSAVRNALGLDSQSQLLFFSTEGDTDPENYQKVVNLK